MSKLRLLPSGLTDVDFTGTRLLPGGLVEGSPTAIGNNPIAVDNSYSVTSGQLLTVLAAQGILANDIYKCIHSFDSAFSSAFNRI